MWLYGSGFPKATDISKQIDKKAGAKRKVIGKKTCGYQVSISKTRKEQGHRPNLTKSTTLVAITEPATDAAKQWAGYKSHGLKPAYEPIIMAIKPNDGSYANNALKWQVAGLNIDAARIGHNEPVKTTERQKNNGIGWHKDNCGLRAKPTNIASADPKGRYPANIILDEKAAEMLDEQSGPSSSSSWRPPDKGGTGNTLTFKHDKGEHRGHNDSGGASRFFYCAKTPKAERNTGCDAIGEKQYSHDGHDKPIENAYQRNNSKATNFHPTVKPLDLMQYLRRLTKPPAGGIILDPFAGSGTTCMAAVITGRDYIGIERESEYCIIAENRLAAAESGIPVKEYDTKQPGLFESKDK